jgi:hypothetical protein
MNAITVSFHATISTGISRGAVQVDISIRIIRSSTSAPSLCKLCSRTLGKDVSSLDLWGKKELVRRGYGYGGRRADCSSDGRSSGFFVSNMGCRTNQRSSRLLEVNVYFIVCIALGHCQ